MSNVYISTANHCLEASTFSCPLQTFLTQNHCLKFPGFLCIDTVITCAKSGGVNEVQCASKETGFVNTSVHHLQLQSLTN